MIVGSEISDDEINAVLVQVVEATAVKFRVVGNLSDPTGRTNDAFGRETEVEPTWQ